MITPRLVSRLCHFASGLDLSPRRILLAALTRVRLNFCARAHGMWTYEPRQGRKAATVVCSASAVVTLAWLFCDLRFVIYDLWRLQNHKSSIINHKCSIKS